MAPSDDTILQFGRAIEPGAVALRSQCSVCGRRLGPDAAFCPYDGEPLVQVARAEPEDDADQRLGQTVDGRYEIQRILGEGGMGTVYLVRHVSLERAFALKAMRRELASEPDVARRFIQEAKAAAAICHPGVVQITDFGALASGEPYFVMDLAEGRSLGREIRERGALDALRAAAILRQVADALGAAHEAGVIHRDVKPENIVIGPRDQVKVLDFGLAKVVGGSKLTRHGVVFGTPHYMSPEQAAGDPVDHRSDIYALGVLAFQMLAGRVPFESDTYMGVMTQHLYRSPPRPSEFVPESDGLGVLEPVILRCLAKNPDDRYQNMSEIVLALDGIASVVTPTLPAPVGDSRIPSPGATRSAAASPTAVRAPVVALVTVLGALIVVVLAVSWRLAQRTSMPVPLSASAAAATQEAVEPSPLPQPPASNAPPSGHSAPPPRPERAPSSSRSTPVEPSTPISAHAPKSRHPPVVGEIVDPWKK